jgi:hypothetical protein
MTTKHRGGGINQNVPKKFKPETYFYNATNHSHQPSGKPIYSLASAEPRGAKIHDMNLGINRPGVAF